MTLHQSAAACKISYRTAFLWRHRFLANARAPTALEGIVEMDETYFLESCKGSRSLRQRRKPRKRGGGRGVPRGRSPAHRPVLTAVARGGATYAQQVPDTTAMTLQANVATWTAKDAVIVSDAHPSYRAATRETARHHQVINRQRGESMRDDVWHINTVNNRHMFMKKRLNHDCRGVSTKYLDNYMRWLQLHDFHPDKTTETNFIVEQVGPDTHITT